MDESDLGHSEAGDHCTLQHVFFFRPFTFQLARPFYFVDVASPSVEKNQVDTKPSELSHGEATRYLHLIVNTTNGASALVQDRASVLIGKPPLVPVSQPGL
jgi:hypothetical protein